MTVDGDSIEMRLVGLLECLTGQPRQLDDKLPAFVGDMARDGKGTIGHSQLNELLLLLGYDRVSTAFFQFLVNGDTEWVFGASLSSLDELEQGVERFRKMALLLYGNVKFAYKTLSTDPELLQQEVARLQPRSETELRSRHPPVHPIEQIRPADTYLTGYLVAKQLRERLDRDRDDHEAQALEAARSRAVERAKRNHAAYLISDHMDVYVATSMRERHEFLLTARLVQTLQESAVLRPLNLRWFDPTQAYCESRIDKGLAEALMLRRAMCTIYLAQETDTLGKDSELASTLAQGKAVIAYVPDVSPEYFDHFVGLLLETNHGRSPEAVLLDQIRHTEPGLAWEVPELAQWRVSPSNAPMDRLRDLLFEAMKSKYDRRADTLNKSHPLGIQVNLNTGVANGVLVARTETVLCELVRRIVTRTLQFKLEADKSSIMLIEELTGSVYRVMTTDKMLTNSFWNFYLDPA